MWKSCKPLFTLRQQLGAAWWTSQDKNVLNYQLDTSTCELINSNPAVVKNVIHCDNVNILILLTMKVAEILLEYTSFYLIGIDTRTCKNIEMIIALITTEGYTLSFHRKGCTVQSINKRHKIRVNLTIIITNI